MFPFFLNVSGLLFGSAEIVLRPNFPSCERWEAPQVQVEQVACLCKEVAGLDFCVGNLLRRTKFIEVYLIPRNGQHPLLYLKMKLEKQ